VEERRRARRRSRVDEDPGPSRCEPGSEPRDTRARRTRQGLRDRAGRRVEETPTLAPFPSPLRPTLPLVRARRQRIPRDRRHETDASRARKSFWDVARTARDRAPKRARRAPIGVGCSVARAAPDREAQASDDRKAALKTVKRRAAALVSGKIYLLTGGGLIRVRRHAAQLALVQRTNVGPSCCSALP
jgi:hypothetical protein